MKMPSVQNSRNSEMKIGRTLSGALANILELCFPSNMYCICCGNLIDKTRPYALCDTCVEKFHWAVGRTCSKCGKPLQENYLGQICTDCMEMDHSFQKGYSCVQLGMYEKEVVHGYKYNGKAYIGKKIAEIMRDRMETEEVAADLVIPVPIHKKKEEKRGFNQAHLIGKHYAELVGLEYDKKILKRMIYTRPMKDLGLAERRNNLKDAFCVEPQKYKELEGKRIILIDDIYTTGSTADECSKVLLEAGAKEVNLLCFAIGANRIKQEDLRDN